MDPDIKSALQNFEDSFDPRVLSSEANKINDLLLAWVEDSGFEKTKVYFRVKSLKSALEKLERKLTERKEKKGKFGLHNL